MDALVDLHRGEAGAALRYGGGEWPGVHAEWLLDEAVAPLCSPEFLRRHRVRKAADLAGLHLIDGARRRPAVVRFAEFLRAACAAHAQDMAAHFPPLREFPGTG